MKKALLMLLAILFVGAISFSITGCNGEEAPQDEVYEEE